MKIPPSTPNRCRQLLHQWRRSLVLSSFEKSTLAGAIKTMDSQLERLMKKRLRITVFGRVGVGKSSLLNALLSEKIFATDVAHGCTRNTKAAVWKQTIHDLNQVELIDTPGIDEISPEGRTRLAKRVALQSDLVLLVIDSDITVVELEALKTLLSCGKPIFLVLNRADQWSKDEQHELVQSIQARLPLEARRLEIQVVSAAPHQAQVQPDGRVRSFPGAPKVQPLHESLVNLLSTQGELLLALNALRQADHFYQSLKIGRLRRTKKAAQGLIGRFAALKASGIAANPLLMLDLAAGFACDTALIMQLSNLYDLQMGGKAARQLLKRVSLYNTFLGGAQLGIQLILGILRQLFLFAIPITNGLSLAPAAPVAVIQAAIAVHTTRLTGRLAAKELLFGSQKREAQPSAMLKRLAASDPQVRYWIGSWPEANKREARQLQALLP